MGSPKGAEEFLMDGLPKSHGEISRFVKTTDLIGGLKHLEKYEFVSWDDDIPNILYLEK